MVLLPYIHRSSFLLTAFFFGEEENISIIAKQVLMKKGPLDDLDIAVKVIFVPFLDLPTNF